MDNEIEIPNNSNSPPNELKSKFLKLPFNSDSDDFETPSEIETMVDTPPSVYSEKNELILETEESTDDDDKSLNIPKIKRSKQMVLTDSEEEEESDIDEIPRKKKQKRECVVELLLGKQTYTMEEWDKLYGMKNTQSIRNGSRLSWDCDFEGLVEMYLVKWRDLSYLHCSWEQLSKLTQLEGNLLQKKLHRFYTNPELINNDETNFNPSYIEIDRILDAKSVTDDGTLIPLAINSNNSTDLFYVKWESLPYSECTWERRQDLVEPEKAISIFFHNQNNRKGYHPSTFRPKETDFKADTIQDVYQNNNLLRSYQSEGVKWLVWNWFNKRNSILADEMGLGKTIQAIGFINHIHNVVKIDGPFLVVAPLSTIANWKREIEEWSDMYCVSYHGDCVSKKIIQDYDWFDSKGKPKFDIVITTPETAVSDFVFLSQKIQWSVMVIDEAHKLKNLNSKLRMTLYQYQAQSILLLTGTPIQNEISELWSLLNFIDRQTFEHYELFAEDFDDLKDGDKVNELHSVLKAYFLRRMKCDVESSLKPKQETLIEVELTSLQKKYYRAIYEKNIGLLYSNVDKSKIPSMMNIMMQLRKCCNHPYLITGVEDQVLQERHISDKDPDFYKQSMELVINTSGKMVLLEKLLPHLQSQGHRVLIFSQMVKVLDILQDYITYKQYSFERLDGSINGSLRQNAIDRFTKEGSNIFVFLICTKAGGLGINLTAADTVIIFDSDWNPQNDIQAEARCHRIGQTKSVNIYRFITRKTYEQEMFTRASLKLGLDKAVLHNIEEGKDKNLLLTKKEMEQLLKYGAYNIFQEEKDGVSEKESQSFCDADINQILEKSSKIITLSNPKDNESLFSKASFISSHSGVVDIDDPNFWEKYVGIKAIDIKDEDDIYTGTRRERRVKTKDSDMYYAEDEIENPWLKTERDRAISALVNCGFGKWDKISEICQFKKRSTADLTNFCIEIIGQWCRALAAYRINHTNTGVYSYIKSGSGRSAHARKEAINAIRSLRSSFSFLDYVHPDITPPTPDDNAMFSNYESVSLPPAVSPILRDETIWKKYFAVSEKNLNVIQVLHTCRLFVDQHDLTNPSTEYSLPFFGALPCDGWKTVDDKYLIIGIAKHGYNSLELLASDDTLHFSVKQLPKFSLLWKRAKRILETEYGDKSRQTKITGSLPTFQDLFSSFGMQSSQSQLWSRGLVTKAWNELETKTLVDLIESFGLPSTHFTNSSNEVLDALVNYEVSSCIDTIVRESTSSSPMLNPLENYTIDTFPYGGYEYLLVIGKIYTKDSLIIFEKILDLVKESQRISSTAACLVKPNDSFTIHTAQRFLMSIELLHILRSKILSVNDGTLIGWLKKINTSHPNLLADLPTNWKSEIHDLALLKSINQYGLKNYRYILKQSCFKEFKDSQMLEVLLSKRAKFLMKFLKQVEPWNNSSDAGLFDQYIEEGILLNTKPITVTTIVDSPKRKTKKREEEYDPNHSSSEDNDEDIQLNEEILNRKRPGSRGVFTVAVNENISREEAHEFSKEQLDGTSLPLTIHGQTILNLGKIDLRQSYHSEKYIWPVGYTSIKHFMSYFNPTVRILYTCEIIDGGDKGPWFKVTPEDDPQNPMISVSPTSAWSGILNKVKEAKRKLGFGKNNTAISGPEYFGYTFDQVATLIEGLPNALECRKYIFRYQRINERKTISGKRKSQSSNNKTKKRRIDPVLVNKIEEIEEDNDFVDSPRMNLRKRPVISYSDYDDFGDVADIESREIEFENNQTGKETTPIQETKIVVDKEKNKEISANEKSTQKDHVIDIEKEVSVIIKPTIEKVSVSDIKKEEPIPVQEPIKEETTTTKGQILKDSIPPQNTIINKLPIEKVTLPDKKKEVPLPPKVFKTRSIVKVINKTNKKVKAVTPSNQGSILGFFTKQ